MQRYSSVTLHVSPKNPISAEKLKITFSKIQIFPRNFFLEWFGPKQIAAIRFRNGFHDKSAPTDCSKEMWILILKGLKHLNTALEEWGDKWALMEIVKLTLPIRIWHIPGGFAVSDNKFGSKSAQPPGQIT